MSDHSVYMLRCVELARLGAGSVAPNPMVGAVLVYGDRIIGEGYHEKFGEPHAEVNCVGSVKDRELIEKSTLYVSLEPCSHFGKTPPCTDLIIKHKIPRVVIGCRDPFPQVDGKGIEKLKAAGVDVSINVLEKECIELNKRFFTFYREHRPYIILKWAQTADSRIAAGDSRLLISNEYTNRLVHKWRSEEAAILVGTRTAEIDDPALTNRLWNGPSPIRLVIDLDLKLPLSLKLFDRTVRTVVFNTIQHKDDDDKLVYWQVATDASLVHQVMNALYQMKIQSVLVEGGAQLIQSFIDESAWDEARVITNYSLIAGKGLPAPKISNATLISEESVLSDHIEYLNPVP